MISKLRIHQFRNVKQATLSLAKHNVLIGKNGSGKTSLLEAVFLLSRGKSFRHHEPKRYISHHATECIVWAMTDFYQPCTLAIKKQTDLSGRSDTTLKFDDKTVLGQSVLSKHLPVLLIDPSSMTVLDEGSATRRQMLDWLVFHVKPDFYEQWLNYQRLLKQRNALLKQANIRQHIHQLTAWDNQLSFYAHALHQHRLQIFEQWQLAFKQMVRRLLPAYQDMLSLSYQAGFDVGTPLLHTLTERIWQDIELGYTRVGSHRADVSVVFKTMDEQGKKVREQASHVLSRGEKKLLITALKLSQLTLICQLNTQDSQLNLPVVLIDDIDAELDQRAVSMLLDTILSLPCQVIITSLNQEICQVIDDKLSILSPSDICRVFHVEQGEFLAAQTALSNDAKDE